MAIGVYITYKILDVADLTVDGTLCTGASVCVVLTLAGAPMWLALLCAILVGMLAGLVTGLFHTACGIPAILAGILTQLALYSVNLRIMGWGTGTGKANLPVSVDKYTLLVSARYVREASLQNPILALAIFVAVVIALLYWFFGTELGASLRATGANQNMARAQGINTSFTKVLGLMLSNGLVALAGALLAQYQGFSDINMGRGAIVIGLAAVIIGEVLFDKLFRNFALKLLGAVIGAIVYYVVIQVVLRMGLSTDDLKLLTAVVVAVFLAVPYWKSRYFSKPVKKGENVHA
jgi:putative ABC transport system permease protein